MSISIDYTTTGHALPAFDDGIERRFLASIPSPMLARADFPGYASSNPVIPRSEWRPIKRPRPRVPILDQDGRGACVGHGAATALMMARDVAGLDFELVSAPFVYALINGGWDRGSSPADAAKVLLDTGVCLMSEFPEPQYLKSHIPAAAYETAKRFRAIEIYQCANFDEMVSAWILGFTLFDTIQVGSNFNSLDADECPPASRGAGNHCIASGDELRQGRNGDWILDHRNSWTEQWGTAGHFGYREQHATAQGQWFECYAIKSPQDDPQAIDNPPVYIA